MDIVISNYSWIKKSDLTEEQLEYLKEQLTVYPLEYKKKDSELPKKIELFTETEISFGIPRSYFLQRRKPHHNVIDKTIDGDTTLFDRFPIKFNGELREIQKQPFLDVMADYNNGGYGGLIQLGTGTGKSVLSLKIIEQLKRPALVVVNKEFLMDQWFDYISKFLPEAKVGRVQGDLVDYKDKHITLGMIHSLAQREYSKSFYNNFGIVIFDEAHHLSSFTFSTVAPKFAARLKYGLSAKLERSDKAENCFYYHIGQIIAQASGTMLKPKIRRVWTNFQLTPTKDFDPNKLPEQTLINILCKNGTRNKQIIQQLIEALKADRIVLVLSSRVKHLKTLQLMFEKEWKKKEKDSIPSHGLYIGEIDKQTRDKTATCRVMFATYQMIAEAFDRSELDTLILTTPISDVLQSVGRVLRSHPTKKDPVIVDFRDDLVDNFRSKGEKRDAIYAKLME